MPEYLVVEPDELRAIAKQHEETAAKIRKWGEIPHAWLAEFPVTYGTIADPMRSALVDYYKKRHDRAERLAVDHERTRDQLLEAARSLEESDQAAGRHVAQSGVNNHGAPLGGPAPGAPTDPAPRVPTGLDTPKSNGTQPVHPSAYTPEAPGTSGETVRSDQVSLPPTASALPPTASVLPPVASAPQIYATAPTETTPPLIDVPESGAAISMAPAADTNGTAGMAGGMPAPLVTDPFAAPVVAGGADMAGGMPAPVATGPFAAAVHAAEDKRALPSFVIGEQVEEDLVLARTLLAATLAAVADSALGLEWAVAVVRTPIGPIVLLTSTEGRGWLPPGLFLPSEVALPWKWDAVLGPAARDTTAALEDTTDPARILAEFGFTARHTSVRISALVSSAAILDDLSTALGEDVAIEGWVSAAESAVDLTAPGVGLVDRLALAGSDELLRLAEMVPEAEIRPKCLELARAADAWVRAAISGVDDESAARHARRQRILDALDAGQPVPASWWGQMRAADDIAAAALRSRRVDVSFIPIGGVRPDVSTEALRGMVFERRADELLLLLAREPDRQTLRDVLYTYGQITEHPLFPVAVRVMTTGAGLAVPDIEVAQGIGPRVHSVGSVSVGPIHLGGGPPPITELLNRPAGSEGSSEQRRG
ncbi:type VII secretion target [Nocardia sp. NPDC051990]|uniref:type VII secretion target n=1 Tax=Nocardia sp. NPDC051990 TaxID=3155285 RepID=UPI00341A2373